MDSYSVALDSDDLPDRIVSPDSVRELVASEKTKIVLLVLDGLGGLPRVAGSLTELETAHTPNLDDLAARGICGLHQPVGFGITPGSGPSHLALFGYDPYEYQVGRGVLSALGQDVFGLKPAAIASYPMYRGVAQLVGMEALETGPTLRDRLDTLRACWEDYDFFFLHVKHIDSAGEDGDFERKVRLIEEVDGLLPDLLGMRPDVLLVTGDHSTPATLRSHSWHPVPTILWSEHCRPAGVDRFGERACISGGLGPRIPATELMPLAMANALRLSKFGA
jgi:2,3-bisphosphoglycerate-independent phosphoglycerate mutase